MELLGLLFYTLFIFHSKCCVKKPCKRRSLKHALSHISCLKEFAAVLALGHLLQGKQEVSPGLPSCSRWEPGVCCRHGVSRLQSELLQHRLGLDAVAAPVSVAGEAGEGQQPYPGMQNKLRGWIRSQQCPVPGQERFLWPDVFRQAPCPVCQQVKYQPAGFPTHSSGERQELTDFQCAQIKAIKSIYTYCAWAASVLGL